MIVSMLFSLIVVDKNYHRLFASSMVGSIHSLPFRRGGAEGLSGLGTVAIILAGSASNLSATYVLMSGEDKY